MMLISEITSVVDVVKAQMNGERDFVSVTELMGSEHTPNTVYSILRECLDGGNFQVDDGIRNMDIDFTASTGTVKLELVPQAGQWVAMIDALLVPQPSVYRAIGWVDEVRRSVDDDGEVRYSTYVMPLAGPHTRGNQKATYQDIDNLILLDDKLVQKYMELIGSNKSGAVIKHLQKRLPEECGSTHEAKVEQAIERRMNKPTVIDMTLPNEFTKEELALEPGYRALTAAQAGWERCRFIWKRDDGQILKGVVYKVAGGKAHIDIETGYLSPVDHIRFEADIMKTLAKMDKRQLAYKG